MDRHSHMIADESTTAVTAVTISIYNLIYHKITISIGIGQCCCATTQYWFAMLLKCVVRGIFGSLWLTILDNTCIYSYVLYADNLYSLFECMVFSQMNVPHIRGIGGHNECTNNMCALKSNKKMLCSGKHKK